MTRAEAIKVQEELRNFFKKKGIWCDVTFRYRPDLRFIIISDISLKVAGNNRPNTESIRMPGLHSDASKLEGHKGGR